MLVHISVLLGVWFSASDPSTAPWAESLALDGGGAWAARIAVEIENNSPQAAAGETLALPVGDKAGQVPIVGQPVGKLRVADAQGNETLFSVLDPVGMPLTAGTVPNAASVVIPVECGPRSSATYYIYFQNNQAWEVPDFLEGRSGVVNGQVEVGEGATPAGWSHDAADSSHRASWSDDSPHSGRRCLKTVVAPDAEPTWIATRQGGIGLLGGAKYRMTAWVRAENVQGFAGWYIHVGNRENPMLLAPTLNGGDGSYGWKQVTAEFTAPTEANLADLGTVLRGTGTAWFDDVTLEQLTPGRLSARVGKQETRSVPSSTEQPWLGKAWEHRAPVHLPAGLERNRNLVAVEAAAVSARLRPGQRQQLAFSQDDRELPMLRYGDRLLFTAAGATAPYLYWRTETQAAKSEQTTVPRGLDKFNLLKNPGFEDGQDEPAGWEHDRPVKDSGVFLGVDAPGREGFGHRCAKLEVSPSAPEGWRGWRQTAAVRPGRSYLVGAWIKCRGVDKGDVRIHIHKHKADGSLIQNNPMTSVGPEVRGTADWSLVSGMVEADRETAALSIHLTTNTSGTIWHDNAVVVEVSPGRLGMIEGRPLEKGAVAWPVNAVVKVFQEDIPPAQVSPAEICVARNEAEPLQLAVRSAEAIRGVRMVVDPPKGPGGRLLNDIEAGAVGFVPIDYPTNYYQSHSPAWRRKTPRESPGCDGWAGFWPDPILPGPFDLAANRTQPLWMTVRVPKDAAAGEYVGAVRLLAGEREFLCVPLTVRVWNFVLPEDRHVSAIFDVHGTGGEKFWGMPADEAERQIVAFMARNRLSPDSVRPVPKFSYANGKVTADFTAFDKAAAWWFDELRIPFSYTPWDFYLFGWGMPPGSHWGEQPYPGKPPFEGADRGQLRPEFKRAYQACLKAFWDHLKEKGWEKRFVLYISDEPFDSQPHIREQMKALCRMIHEVDPAIPIYSSTWKHVPEWDGSLNVWGIGHYGVVPAEQIAKIRQGGARVWFTTDGQMCTDTPYCAVERLLPHYCFQYGAQAYEFWGVSWYTYDPFRYGWHAYIHQTDQPGKSYYVRYPNGDGFLLYPGGLIGRKGPISSIRFEQAREGVEDYEYLYLLRDRVAKAKAAGRDAALGEQALARAARLVTIPNAGGRWSSKILPDPDEVFTVRRAVAEAIEELSHQ